METVESYGLYWDDNVAWLVQGRGGANFVGLKQKCPFKAAPRVCNHLIPTAAPVPDKLHWNAFLKVIYDPLVQAMLPIPHDEGDKCFFLEDPSDSLGLYLTTLSRLSSPLRRIIKPAWAYKAQDLDHDLQQSNIQPLIITQAGTKNQQLITKVAKFSSYIPRTTIFTGSTDIVVQAPMKRIKTSIQDFNLDDLMMLPLEGLGATILRRSSRKEPIEAPMETREERRNRQIRERTHP